MAQFLFKMARNCTGNTDLVYNDFIEQQAYKQNTYVTAFLQNTDLYPLDTNMIEKKD